MQGRDRSPSELLSRGFLILLLCACTSSGLTGRRADGLNGTIRISGAWALYPLMTRWGEAYQESNPGVRFEISAGGAGLGMSDVLAGEVDIAMVSRGIDPEEVRQGAFWIPVARDAVFPVVNAANPAWETLQAHGLSKSQLIQVFLHDEPMTWDDLVGDPMISNPVHVYTRADSAGGPATWAEFLGGVQAELKGLPVEGEPGMLEAVRADPLALGYNSLIFAFDLSSGSPQPGIEVLPIDFNGDEAISPDERHATREEAIKAVISGVYPPPLSRELYLVSRGKPSGLVEDFLRWTLEAGQEFVMPAGYVLLSQVRRIEGLRMIE